MKRILRYIGIGIAVLVGLLVVAVIVLPMVINPNDYRGRISQAVKDRTGRDLTINGDIKLSVFPWLGLELGETSLGDAPGFGTAPFARIKDAEVRVRVLPLIRGKIEVGTVHLDGLSVRLMRNKAGATNWQDLAGSGPGVKSPAGGAKGGTAPPPLLIGGVQVADANFVFTDARAGTRYEVKDVDLSLGALAPGEPMPVKLDAEFDSTKPQLVARIALAGTARLDLERQRYGFDGARLKFDAHGAAIPLKTLAAELAWKQASFNAAAGTFSLAGMEVSLFDMHVRAGMDGSGLNGDQARFKGTLDVPAFSARKLLADLGQPLVTADPSALSKVSAQLSFDASPRSAQISKLALEIDTSKLRGSAAVTNLKTGATRFALTLDSIDLDRYLPPAAQKQAGGGASNLDNMPLPTKPLRALNVQGRLGIGKLHAFSINSQDIAVGVQASGGQVVLKPLVAKLYGGSYKGDIRLDARTDALGVSMDEHVNAIDLGALVRDVAGVKRISGTVEGAVKLSGRGATLGAMRRTLAGTAVFDIKHGALEGIDLWHAIRSAYALAKKKPGPATPSTGRTEFADLSGSAKVEKGVARNDDLKADLPFLRVTGAGTVDLVKQDIDYLVKAKVVKVPDVGSGEQLGDLQGVTIPVRITGSFSKLSARPDIGEMVKEKAKAEVKKKVKEKAKDLLKDIFGGGG